MSGSPGLSGGLDPDADARFKALQSGQCAGCREDFPYASEFGKQKHAILDKVHSRILVYCTKCNNELKEDGRIGGITKGIDKDPTKFHKKKAVSRRVKKKARLISESKSASKYYEEEEDEEEDDEEEDEGDDEFAAFFKSVTGRAVKLMLKSVNRRLDDLEKKMFKE